MKKGSSLRYAFLALLIFAAFIFFGVNNFLQHSFYGNRTESFLLNGEKFRVERVDDIYGLKKGLGKRRWMCGKCGMTFYFKESDKHSFWMKDMQFPLDIIWIFDDEVVWIEKNVSHLDQKKLYAPPVNAQVVLELRSGSCDEFGIKVGDRIIRE